MKPGKNEKFSKRKVGEVMAEEKLWLVMDDTANSGKEPYKFKDEQERKALDDLIERFFAENNL
jgi:hypothetical protein